MFFVILLQTIDASESNSFELDRNRKGIGEEACEGPRDQKESGRKGERFLAFCIDRNHET